MPTKTKEKRKVKPAIACKRIRGLQGIGLIRFSKESRLELRDRLQMPRVLFGRVVNASERTIAKVEAAPEQIGKLRDPTMKSIGFTRRWAKWLNRNH